MKDLPPDLTGEFDLRVGPEHTANAMGNPGMGVLATPYVVWIIEAAAHSGVEPYLEAGEGVAGVHIDLRHLAPTAVGRQVHAVAHLLVLDGRRLTYRATVTSGGKVVAEGHYESVVVTLDRILAAAAQQPADE